MVIKSLRKEWDWPALRSDDPHEQTFKQLFDYLEERHRNLARLCVSLIIVIAISVALGFMAFKVTLNHRSEDISTNCGRINNVILGNRAFLQDLTPDDRESEVLAKYDLRNPIVVCDADS